MKNSRSRTWPHALQCVSMQACVIRYAPSSLSSSPCLPAALIKLGRVSHLFLLRIGQLADDWRLGEDEQLIGSRAQIIISGNNYNDEFYTDKCSFPGVCFCEKELHPH